MSSHKLVVRILLSAMGAIFVIGMIATLIGNGSPVSILGFSAAAQQSPDNLTDQQPVAFIHGPAKALAGDRVTFSASQSLDPDGDPLSYSWQISGQKAVTTEQPEYSFIAPPVKHKKVLLITLSISDGKQADIRQLQLVVTPAQPATTQVNVKATK